MLKPLEQIEVIHTSYFTNMQAPQLRYYASEIMEELGCEASDEIQSALNRAIQACRSMQVPIDQNFRQVYRYDGEKLVVDWKLSSLGCYLLVVNADPCNPVVARAQLYVFMKH